MQRKRKLFYNTTISLLNQVITIICGFILPRFILKYYGSTTNGLITSISQFLGFISLCECGVGAVVQSALYRPLAENDNQKLSKIYKASSSFFKKIAIILIGYTIFLIIFFPYIVKGSFDKNTTIMLVISIALNYFGQYFLGMSNKILLNSDQLSFIQYGINSITLIINTIISITLMYFGFNISVMKLCSSIIFLIQPLCLKIFVERKYNLNRKVKLDREEIPQKWNGMAQHVATVILTNTDTVVLTFLSTLENVSIYGVYNLVVTGLKQLIISITSGVQSLFGNMYVNKEEALIDFFAFIEWIIHYLVTLVFGVALVLIIPFISVYTKDINDVNYIVPAFGFLITIAQAFYCYRLPYSLLVMAVGHYKQTQNSAIIEAAINVCLSIILVYKFGIIGVTIGTIIAMGYRTIYYVFYLKNNILNRNIKHFIKHVIVDILSLTLMYFSNMYIKMNSVSYTSWIGLALIVFVICFLESIVINFIFYKKDLIYVWKKFFKNK